MAKEQQQRANQIGAYANQEAAPAFVSVWSARDFCEEVDGEFLSLISSVPERFGERKIIREHSKRGIARVRLTLANPALPMTIGRNPNAPPLPSRRAADGGDQQTQST
jgi:hypothetical protein